MTKAEGLMGILFERIKLVGSKGERDIIALFDSGASYSFIKKELAKELETIISLPIPLEFETVREGEKLAVNEAIRLDFFLNGERLSDEFLVVEELTEDVIIGVATMQKWRIWLNFEEEKVVLGPRVRRLMLKNACCCF